MSNEDFELTSEDPGNGARNATDSDLNIKIREVTKSGNLHIPVDEIWPYWQVLKSDNLFTRLFIEAALADKITNETIVNHFEEIKRYLDKWRERESTGISFSQSHGGYSIAELFKKLNEAYDQLRGKTSREEYHREYLQQKKNQALRSLEPIIKAVMADKVLTYEEKTMVYQE
ncbi:MAG: hypothetical protein HUU43_07655, partial [Ignavibacteriaceae bacterium]|nr:hypothetical protein [Ignavibacteriaceae bacterium]